jgi:hypothetical protein
VTRSQGRVVAVEPDNTSRSAYSSVPSGAAVFETAERVFAAVSADHARSRVGPRLAHLFSRNRIEPVEVRLFPVSLVFLGVPADDVWQERRRVVEALARVEGAALGTLAADYLELLGQYEADARTAGAGFVEIQNTTLFATVGQRT